MGLPAFEPAFQPDAADAEEEDGEDEDDEEDDPLVVCGYPVGGALVREGWRFEVERERGVNDTGWMDGEDGEGVETVSSTHQL